MSLLRPDEINQVQTALAARGFRTEIPLLLEAGCLPRGSAIIIQFGDLFAVGTEGRPRLVIAGAFQVNADGGDSPAFVRLSIERVHTIWAERSLELSLKIDLQLAIERDLHPADGLMLGTSSIQTAQAYRHLQGLIEDARNTLQGLPVDCDRKELGGPAVRVEARLLGEFALGRTGIVRSAALAVSLDFMRCSLAACNWMQETVLPDLRRVVRDLTGNRVFLPRVALTRAVAVEQHARALLPRETTGLTHAHETIQ